jgi:copper transport protein
VIRRRAFTRVGALGALSAAFVVLLATPAFAHAVLLQTIPGEGGVLTTPPKTVTLRYNEQVEASLGAVRIYDSNAHRVDSGTITKPAPDTVQVAVPQLRAGAYVVTWRVISADSHPVQGSFTFQVGLAANATSPQVTGLATRLLHQQGGDTTLGAVDGVVRGALFAGLALLFGAAAFGILVWPGARHLRRTRQLVGLGWGLTAAATVAGVVVQGPYGAGLTLADAFKPDLIRQVLDTRYGQMALLRLALLVVAIPLLRLVGRRADEHPLPAWWAPTAGVLAAALALSVSLAGHARTGTLTGVAVPADVVHILAMGLWLGGLAVLAIAVFPGRQVDDLQEVVPRFSRLAFWCVAALVITGGFQAWRQVGSINALRNTDYGQILLVKSLVVLILVVVAALSRQIAGYLFPAPRRVAPAPVPVVAGGSDDLSGDGAVDDDWDEIDERHELKRLRRTVATEIVIAVAVIAVTAVLVNAAPAKIAQAQPGGAAGVTLKSDQVWVDITAAPGTAPAANDMHVTAINPAGAPVNPADVVATLDYPARHVAPLTIPLRRLGPGHYLSPGFTIPFKGTWRITAHVRFDQFTEVTIAGPLNIG